MLGSDLSPSPSSSTRTMTLHYAKCFGGGFIAYRLTSKQGSHLTITAHVTVQPEVLPYFISDTASLVTAIQTLLHLCAFAQAVCSTENVFSFFLQALSSMPAQENNGFGPAQTGFRFWLSTFELCCPEQVQARIYPVQSCLR